MYKYEEQTRFGKIVWLCADEGKKILVDDTLVDKVAMGKYATLEDFIEVDDAYYIPPTTEPEEQKLTEIQENQIELTKKNLAKYLEDNPLFSRVKYKDGRYYNVTFKKQQQLSSKLMLYKLYESENIPYILTWNDTGNISEEWTYEELLQLSAEINDYVSPLILEQQRLEIDIKNAENQEELLRITTHFNK